MILKEQLKITKRLSTSRPLTKLIKRTTTTILKHLRNFKNSGRTAKK